jgi:hypothetical protein
MLDGERLVWAAAARALVSALVVPLALTYSRHNPHHGRVGHETRLYASVLALGLLVVVLVAVAFVAGYAALERRSEYIIVAVSVLCVGMVLYNDATRPQRGAPHAVRNAEGGGSDRAEGHARDRAPSSQATAAAGRRSAAFESFFVHASTDEDPVVLAAAARAEACMTRVDDADPVCADPSDDGVSDSLRRPYTLGVRFGRIPRS